MDNIKDLEAWLRGDSSDESEKTASDNSAGVDPEHELMEKLAQEFEDEQFQKLASDAWTMGEIMAHSFISTMEKQALAEVDDRIAGDISQSVQGEAPMMHQKLEDEKAPAMLPEKNVSEGVVQKMINRKVTMGASVEGEDPRQDSQRQLMPPAGPSSGNVEMTSMSDAQKKVAHFLQSKLASKQELSKEESREALVALLRG